MRALREGHDLEARRGVRRTADRDLPHVAIVQLCSRVDDEAEVVGHRVVLPRVDRVGVDIVTAVREHLVDPLGLDAHALNNEHDTLLTHLIVSDPQNRVHCAAVLEPSLL